MKWKKLVNESTSSLSIDYLIECAFLMELEDKKSIHSTLKHYLRTYDFQDTELNNETECYFYFPIDEMTEKDLEECKESIREILGLPDYEFREEEQEDGMERVLRLDAICHIEI